MDIRKDDIDQLLRTRSAIDTELRRHKIEVTVLFTDVIDRTASEALVAQAATLRPRHLPLAVTLRNPEMEALASRRPADQEDAFQRAAAEELLGA